MKTTHTSPRRCRPAPRGLALCALLSVPACVGALGCARETTPVTTPAAAPASSTGVADESAESEPGGGPLDPDGHPQAEASGQDDVAQPVVEAPAEPPAADVPVVVDMTPAAAPAICAALADEPESVRRCAFLRGGLSLPGGARADVLELTYDSGEIGEIVQAHLVVRIPIDEYPTTQLLGERSDVPGMSSTYSLGRLERTPSGLQIRVTRTDTTYPDTGGPGPGRAEVERSRLVVTCTLDAETQYYDCARD